VTNVRSIRSTQSKMRTAAVFISLGAIWNLVPVFSNTNPANAASAVITGTAFRDYNQNGTKDTLEPGFGGITVTGFDLAGVAVGTATSGPTGAYSLTVSNGGAIRVEFSGWPAYVKPGPQGSGSGTTQQFVDTASLPSGGVNFGVASPADYCQNNPKLALSCFFKTTPANTAVFSVPEDATLLSSLGSFSTQAQVGSVYGMAYHRSSKTLFAAAFTKPAGIVGPSGPTAIYKMSGTGTNSGSLFVDIASIGSATSSGTVTGDSSLGELAMDDNGHTLWAVNLTSKTLVSMEVGSGPTPIVPTTSTSYPIPKWCEANGKGTSRAFAVSAHNNEIYLGGMCSGTLTPLVSPTAFVFQFSGGAFGATPVVTQDFSINRGLAGQVGDYTLPWPSPSSWKPMLTQITFVGEDLVLGFRPLSEPGVPGGEILRACRATATSWTMESAAAATCPGSSFSRAPGDNPNPGPGGREFYWGDTLYIGTNPSAHYDALGGGVVQIPGRPNVQTSMNDAQTFNAGGFASINNTTGKRASSLDIYGPSSPLPGNFGKGNGIGGIEALCDLAPIEIGNRVWSDIDNDGIQDPGEPGIAGVTVQLTKGGVVVATASTAADGTYLFNAANVPGGIVANANDYKIVVPNITGGSQQVALAGFSGTPSNAGSNDGIDSDVVPIGNDSAFPVPAADIAEAGFNNHTYDFGFKPRAATSTTSSPSTTTTTKPTTTAPTTTTAVPPTSTIAVTTTTVGGPTKTFAPPTDPPTTTATTTAPKGTTTLPPFVPTTLPADKAVLSATVSNEGAEQPYVILLGSQLPFTG
jgi:hypothetical protein